MDSTSQQAVLLLNVIATTVDQLQSFGYTLYLETKAPSWTQSRSPIISGEGYQILHGSQSLRFDRALILSFTLQCDTGATRWIEFSILFAWNKEYWFVQSTIEEVFTDEQVNTVLWESPEYRADTIDIAIQYLRQAFEALTQNTVQPKVAQALATIEQR